MKKEEEHGFAHVLFCIQVSWIATLGISKKEYFIKMGLAIALLPFCLFLGYSEFAERLNIAGSATYENAATNLFASMILLIYYGSLVFPYAIALNIIVFTITKMWTKDFWIKVEELK